MKSLGGWQRLFVVIAAMWAIVVVGYSISLWPKMMKQELFAEWATQRIEVMRTFSGDGLSHSEFRIRVFGDKTDEEIAQPKKFDLATAKAVGENIGEEMVRVAEIAVVDDKHKRLLPQASSSSHTEFVLFASLIWAAPLLILVLLSRAAVWVRDGFLRPTP